MVQLYHLRFPVQRYPTQAVEALVATPLVVRAEQAQEMAAAVTTPEQQEPPIAAVAAVAAVALRLTKLAALVDRGLWFSLS